MVSSNEHSTAPAADETANSKVVSPTLTTNEAANETSAAAEEQTASKQDDQEAKEASSSSSAEALTGDVGRLSLGNDNGSVGDAKTPATETASASTPAATTDDDPERKPINAQTEEVSTEQLPSNTASLETTVEPTSSATNDEPEASTSDQTSATPATAEAQKQDQEQESAVPTLSTSHAAAEQEEADPIGKPASVSEPTEHTASDHADGAAVADSTPPTPPTKEGPQPPEKGTAGEFTAGAAQVDLSSKSVSQTPPRTNREALADAESVAAVAHAFRRDSPALRSSIHTPQRVATPTEHSRPLLQTSGENEKEKEKPETSTSGTAAESSKGAAQQTVEASAGSVSAERGASTAGEKGSEDSKDEGSSRGGLPIGKGPPSTTQASEERPFDFNRFLEQMKHRSAQPVGEYVRSFIKGFAKKPYRTQDQIKLIFDFLDFIAARMRECDVWKDLGDSDFENAKEAMEKLVMNRLYPYTFTPAVQKEGRWAVQTDDLERDRVLRQRIGLFGWLSEEHLDVPVGDHSRGFIGFSIQELLKINHYKAPRDKLICILNCCKVIFGMIRHLSTQENADNFIPVLIFVVLKANPEHLISNVEYISRFRNPDRLSSESGYYLSSLMGAIAFIETMDYTSLSNITQEEFEKRVEEAVSSLPEPEPSASASAAEANLLVPPTTPPPGGAQPPHGNPQHQRSVSATSMSAPSGPGEEAAKALPFTPMAASLADDTRAFFLRTGEAARTGLSRPMGALGRLINEGIEGIRTPSSSNNDSGASTERHNSPAPTSVPGSSGIPPSNSRSKLFGGLFGSLDSSDGTTQPRTAGYPGQQAGRRSTMLVDDEPQTPSTDELTQGGFHPYRGGPAGGAPNAPPRLLRHVGPQRNHSIDDSMFDDESAGRRNLMATSAGRGQGQQHPDYYDDDDEDEVDAMRSTPNAAAAEQMRRRMQMQQDFGRDVSSTPSRRAGGAVEEQRRLQPGRREEIAYENAQTEQAIQRSLMDQERLDAVHADEAAQNSASVETLKSIFPTMDDGVIQMVLQGCEGNVETAIDRLLEMQ